MSDEYELINLESSKLEGSFKSIEEAESCALDLSISDGIYGVWDGEDWVSLIYQQGVFFR